MRHPLAIYSATSKFVDRDLSAVLCDQLESSFDVVWLFSREVPKMFVGRNVHRLPGLSTFRFRVWLYLFELEKYAYRQPLFGADQPMPHLGLSRLSRSVLAAILRSGLAPLWRRISHALLRRTRPEFPALPDRLEACVCFTAPNDPVFDDIVRHFKPRGVPVVMVPLNWDNASSKPYLERPDVIFTWGEQTAELSRELHGIPTIALGSPRFDSTRVPPPPTPEAAHTFLGLDPKLTYVLFAGASFPFDEPGALNTLAACLRERGLRDHRIIYRPHPLPWSRSHVSEWSDDARHFVRADPTATRFADDDLRLYQYLFAVSQGLITPYSTMIVEAAMYGVPSLAIGYNSNLHPEFDWSANSRRQPHLVFTQTAPWVVECHDQADLAGAFQRLLALVGSRDVSDRARRDFTRHVRVTHRSYGDELVDAIRTVIDAPAGAARLAS